MAKCPEGYQRVTRERTDLIECQRAGLLYWRDPACFPPEAQLPPDYHRMVHLSRHRDDFTEQTLRAWAARGQLFELLPLESRTLSE